MTKSLQDKVVIVTGAGRGIGREIALLCAAEGAKVVVNDPGGAADGSGTSAAPAEEVVEEIKKRGGTAIANFETVAEAIPASRIVKMATDHFGKLDGVVNNAGILRDMIFHRMSVEDHVAQDAGIVDDAVELAEMIGRHLDDAARRDRFRDRLEIRNGGAAALFDFLDHFLGRRGTRARAVGGAAGIVDHDLGALGGAEQRDLAPDA